MRVGAGRWVVREVDGHDLAAARRSHPAGPRAPVVVVARTVFGRGVSFMERRLDWHYLPMDDDQFALAMAEQGGMRNAVLDELPGLAAADERIVFLTGDLGYGVVEPFFERFPDRAFNVGVAEQNMAAVAGGLAAAGLIPFIYSIASFASMRPFEFIRNGAVVPRLPVRVIGVGGGMEYSNNGPTHFALEDVGMFRALPGIRIVCPADDRQARAAVAELLRRRAPRLLPAEQGHRARRRRPRRGARRRGRGGARPG